MGIDVGNANIRANELRNYASQLRTVQNYLEQYRDMFESSWQAVEVTYYNNAIESVKMRLIQAIAELESIGDDIVSAADQIRVEEEAAERARHEAEERARREAEAAAAAAASAWTWTGTSKN